MTLELWQLLVLTAMPALLAGVLIGRYVVPHNGPRTAGVRKVAIVRAGTTEYCVESTVGSTTYHKDGPAGDIVEGACAR